MAENASELGSHRSFRNSVRALVASLAAGVLAVTVASPAKAANPSGNVNLVIVNTTYLLAEEFQHNNHAGLVLRTYMYMPCTATSGDVDAQWPGPLPSNWGNNISSYRNYSGCLVRHFANTNYSGGDGGYFDDRASMEVVPGNDNTESLRYS